MDFIAYHDRTSADHQGQFNRLYPQGYRIISLSVYGRRHDERYAAVWVRRGGPDWSAVHGVDFAGYQAAFDRAANAGFKPVILAASGPANDPVYAGTFEKTNEPIPLTRHSLRRGDPNDAGTIDHWMAEARRNNWYPTCLAIFGTGNDLRYAGIWEADRSGVCWTQDGLSDTFAQHQQRFDALVPVGARPVYVAVSADEHYASIYRDDQIGDWVARHGMTSQAYQHEFDRFVGEGFYPINVQGGGEGANTRFAAIFARQESIAPPVWHQPTGPTTVQALDDVIRQAMERHRIRGAGLALVRKGRLVYARGYTYAESGYPSIQPTTFFRQASVSKTIVALAAHRLIQDGRLALTTPVQNILQLRKPDGSAPAASFGEVTVQHLLEHRSGLPTNPYGVEPNVVAAFNAAVNPPVFTLPVDGRMTDRYMLTLPATTPPANPAYSNWGYFLLGHVVMAVTQSATLIDAIRPLLMQPLGITRLRLARTRIDQQAADEARYHPTNLFTSPSVVLPDRRLAANGYGGFWNLERNDGGGGLSAAVVDVARLLAMLDIRTNNPVLTPAAIANLFTLAQASGGHGFDMGQVIDAANGVYYAQKGGSLPESSQNVVRYSTNDFSMVLCWNRSDITEGSGGDGWWYPDYPALLTVARAQSWGNQDLFPSFGMPSLA
jgi:CubicO group peptidase (beta-lactamase class C family)